MKVTKYHEIYAILPIFGVIVLVIYGLYTEHNYREKLRRRWRLPKIAIYFCMLIVRL